MKFTTLSFVSLLLPFAVAAPQNAGSGPPTNPPTSTSPSVGPPTAPPGSPPSGSNPPSRNFLIQIDAKDWAGRDGMDGRWIRPEADPVSGVNYLTVNQPGESKASNFWFGKMWNNGLGNINYVVPGASLWGGFQREYLANRTANAIPVQMANTAAADQMWWFEDTFFGADGHWERMPRSQASASGPQAPADQWALCWVKIQDTFDDWKMNDRLALHWYRNKGTLDTSVCWPVRVRIGR